MTFFKPIGGFFKLIGGLFKLIDGFFKFIGGLFNSLVAFSTHWWLFTVNICIHCIVYISILWQRVRSMVMLTSSICQDHARLFVTLLTIVCSVTHSTLSYKTSYIGN